MIPSHPAATVGPPTATGRPAAAGEQIEVRPDPVHAAAARLDRVAESLRAMATAAGGSLSRAAPATGDTELEPLCESAGVTSRIRLAGLGEWSTQLAGRLRKAVETYAEIDARAGGAVAGQATDAVGAP